MADSDERQVSSTTPLFSEGIHHYQAEMDPEPDQPKQNLFSVDDIVDLVGGAQDALERHIAEDSAPHEVTETPLAPISEPVRIPEPEPEPEVKETGPGVAKQIPDSTVSSFVPETLIFSGESQVVSPKAEPERTNITPEPETAPQRDALPAAGLRKTAPAPAEAAQRPAVKEDSPTPATCELIGVRLQLSSAVVDLLYWRDVKTTGVVFGAALLLLLSLTVCSIVSVCSYVGLALLSVTICFRIYKGILQAIQKSDEGHPFKQYLDQEVALSDDMVHKYSDMALAKINKTIGELRRLFLVEDLVDSIKFAVLMWILTYVGALFNGLTLLILGLIGAFSCPIVYEKHQAQIDHYLSLVNNQVKEVVGKIQAKVPGMKRKAE
ncbi:reticulon-3-like isoform X4 [Echeneis naucrates]|uniref:reticulon-3-like isoform X4 n=1 Tax=Echeneis naucrates TaxID=173247 RepID=UPI001113F826|nr:reticulon-3-like isoform X4 [Echeneis naucrates]